MAEKSIYLPNKDKIGVIPTLVQYQYFSGFSLSQKQKSIASLHNSAREIGINKVLEASSKSTEEIGIQLSAFNLLFDIDNKTYTVEQLFQSSKIFENGGPFIDLLNKTSKDAKTDDRLKESGNLVGFCFFGESFPLEPKTFFYDWLYINALLKNKKLISSLTVYDGFSDIEFNEKKSINCQAYSLALFCSILKNRPDILKCNSISKSNFLLLCKEEYETRAFKINSSKQKNIKDDIYDVIQSSLKQLSKIERAFSKLPDINQEKIHTALYHINEAKTHLEEQMNEWSKTR